MNLFETYDFEKFKSLKIEAEFASYQLRRGFSHLCVAAPEDFEYDPLGSPFAYRLSLHEGLLSVTTSLERLAKIALSLKGLRDSHQFPSLRRYGHDLKGLFKEIDSLDELAECEDVRFRSGLEIEGEGTFNTKLLNLLTDYSKGNQRYEHLDRLAEDSKAPKMYGAWSELVAERSEMPRWLDERLVFISLLHAYLYTFDDNDESSRTGDVLDDVLGNRLKRTINRGSTLSALRAFHYAKWLAHVIKKIEHDIQRGASDGRSVLVNPTVVNDVLLGTDSDYFDHAVLEVNNFALCFLEVTNRISAL